MNTIKEETNRKKYKHSSLNNFLMNKTKIIIGPVAQLVRAVPLCIGPRFESGGPPVILNSLKENASNQ